MAGKIKTLSLKQMDDIFAQYALLKYTDALSRRVSGEPLCGATVSFAAACMCIGGICNEMAKAEGDDDDQGDQ